MQNTLLKQVITLTGLILTGLISLLGVPNAQIAAIEVGQWQVFPSLYSISITHNQNKEDFYKISPYDDVIFYEDGTWDKVIHGNEQILNDNLIETSFWFSFASPLDRLRRIFDKKIVWSLRALLKKPQVNFLSSEKSIAYQAYKDKEKLIVKKKITKLPKKAVGFGNSFVFSKDDEIFDSEGKQYLLSEFKEDRIEISGTSGLFFKNPANTGQIFLPISPAQKVIIDRIYRLVEVRIVFPEVTGEVEVEQEILFK